MLARSIADEIDQDCQRQIQSRHIPVKLKAHFNPPGESVEGSVELVWFRVVEAQASQSYIDVRHCGNGASSKAPGKHRVRLHLPCHYSNDDDGD